MTTPKTKKIVTRYNTRYNKDELLADWKTGKYSERDLASKYRISPATVHKNVTGVDKSIAPLISAQVEINQQIAELSEQELSRFKQEVDERTKHIMFFNNAAIVNVAGSLKLPCDSQNDFKARAETISKGREVVLGKTPETQVNVQNNTFTKIERVIVTKQ